MRLNLLSFNTKKNVARLCPELLAGQNEALCSPELRKKGSSLEVHWHDCSVMGSKLEVNWEIGKVFGISRWPSSQISGSNLF